MGLVQLLSLVTDKRHGSACAIVPKGKAITLGVRGDLSKNWKVGHTVCVHFLF